MINAVEHKLSVASKPTEGVWDTKAFLKESIDAYVHSMCSSLRVLTGLEALSLLCTSQNISNDLLSAHWQLGEENFFMNIIIRRWQENSILEFRGIVLEKKLRLLPCSPTYPLFNTPTKISGTDSENLQRFFTETVSNRIRVDSYTIHFAMLRDKTLLVATIGLPPTPTFSVATIGLPPTFSVSGVDQVTTVVGYGEDHALSKFHPMVLEKVQKYVPEGVKFSEIVQGTKKKEGVNFMVNCGIFTIGVVVGAGLFYLFPEIIQKFNGK